jgi:diguanylate cyclase (GGDEF)-like protein
VVPIIARDVWLALLSVGVESGPERLAHTPDLVEKLNGVAALAAPALENRRLLDELGHQVIHDGLTGVLNRTGFIRALEPLLSGNGHVGLLYVDVDGFKLLNDEHGHGVGDELLRDVAERLRKTMRGIDSVARLGGDEFAVILPRVRTREEVSAAAARVQAAFAVPFALAGLTLSVRVSVGEALAPEDGAGVDALVRQADTAMYLQKALHRQTVRAAV